MDQKKESWGETIRFVVIVIIIFLPIRYFIVQPFIVSGDSMVPTFTNHNYLLVDEVSYRIKPPARGDVIVFYRPEEKKYLIKRIVGLPGETVTIAGTRITIKKSPEDEEFFLDESYVKNMSDMGYQKVTLDLGHYYVLGDNRPVSYDSRYWGPLDKRQITGRPLLRLYPFGEIGFFPGLSS